MNTRILVFALFLSVLFGMSNSFADDTASAFRNSHDQIRAGMTLKDVFSSGLSDYLVAMKVKNIPGGKPSGHHPIIPDCSRYILDISYYEVKPNPGSFWVRVYCNQNSPSAKQPIPEQAFSSKELLYEALEKTYSVWAKSMSFRVESPPKRFGEYDHYEFSTNEEGKVAEISSIVAAN